MRECIFSNFIDDNLESHDKEGAVVDVDVVDVVVVDDLNDTRFSPSSPTEYDSKAFFVLGKGWKTAARVYSLFRHRKGGR